MEESVVENNKIKLLSWILLIEFTHTLVCSLLDGFNRRDSLIYPRCLLLKFSNLVVDILTLEISEEEVSHELLILEAGGIAELVLGRLIENVLISLLVLHSDQLVLERTKGLVTPETDHEESWINLLLQLTAALNDLILVKGSNSGNTSKHTCKLTNGEQVVEFGWCGEELLEGGFPHADGGVDEDWDHVDDVLRVLLAWQKLLKNLTVDGFDGLR